MAEVLAEFPEVLVDHTGVRYHAHACGAPMPDGLWEGWLEFLPLDGGPPIRSERETTQPNEKDAIYWATGLTPVYLEGALKRALNPRVVRTRTLDEPAFNGPARANHAAPAPAQEAVLNPFSVIEKGEDLLRRQLGALSAWHLVNIIKAYGLSDDPDSALNHQTAARLIETIVSEVRSRVMR